MNQCEGLSDAIRSFVSILLVGVSMSADAALFGIGPDRWKEEVLLHNGQKIIVKRSQTYGGRHELGQPLPTKEHTIVFTPPGSDKTVTWTSEYGEELGRTNFNLLAVHVLRGTPYLVASPNLCLSYNKWGRPNPPYVFFKYDGKEWRRIPLDQLPLEFKTLNVAINLSEQDVHEMVSLGIAPIEKVRELNNKLSQPEYRTILREPVKRGTEGSSVNCEEMIHYKCGWISARGEFGRKLMDSTCK